jgi:hypothetical protein
MLWCGRWGFAGKPQASLAYIGACRFDGGLFVSNTLEHYRYPGAFVVLLSDGSKLGIKQLLPDAFRFLANARSLGSVPLSGLFTRPRHGAPFLARAIS